MKNAKWCLAIVIGVIITFISIKHRTTMHNDMHEYDHQRSLMHTLKDYKNIVPVAIIGAGPAGISAAMYTARARFTTIVFGGQKIGGELLEASYVENWPAKEKMTGQQIMKQAEGQATLFGAHIVPLEVKKVDLSTWPFVLSLDNNDQVHALSVIVATGGSQKLPSIPAIKRYYGKGVGICTICDAPFDKDAEVAVVGGGDAACDKALQLAAYAKKVTVIVRESSMKAAAIVQEYVKVHKHITILYDTELLDVQGDDHQLKALSVRNTKTSDKQTIPVKSVYFALGYSPNSQLFKNQLTTDQKGYIVVKSRTHKTNLSAVFAAGNVIDPYYQKSGYAAGSGIGAALDAIGFLTQLDFISELQPALKEHYYLPDMSVLIQSVRTQQELSSITNSKEQSIVIFHAHHCPICQEIIRFSNNAAQQLKQTVRFVSIVIDDSQELFDKYGIQQTPTILILDNNKVQNKFERSSLEHYKEYINGLISHKGST